MNIFIVLMVIYIVAMLILGYLGSKRATDSTSYATSNGDVSVFNVSITFAATFASAGTFLGFPVDQRRHYHGDHRQTLSPHEFHETIRHSGRLDR